MVIKMICDSIQSAYIEVVRGTLASGLFQPAFAGIAMMWTRNTAKIIGVIELIKRSTRRLR